MENIIGMKSNAQQQPRELSLRTNFSWTFVGNVIYAACQWGMLTVLAKLGSPEHVGQFALGTAIVTPFIMFTNLQLRQVQSTDAKSEYQFSDYLGLRLVTTLLALVIIAGIALFGGYQGETALVILAFSASKGVESISDVYYGLMQYHERMDYIARSMMVRGVLSLLALTIAFVLTRSVFWGVVGIAAGWAMVLVGYDIRNGVVLLRSHKALIMPRWDRQTLLKLVWLTLPLGIVMMLINLNTNIPRYFIERYLGEYELGIFAAMTYLIVVGTTVIYALGQSASPRLAKYYAVGNVQAFRGLLIKLVGIGAVLGVSGVLVTLVAGKEILTLLYGPEYARVDVFVLVMVAAGMKWTFFCLGNAMTALRYFWIQIPVFIITSLIVLLISFWFIPSLKLIGASIALMIEPIVWGCSWLFIILYVLRQVQKEI